MIEIVDFLPAPPGSPDTVARFAVRLGPDVKLCGFRLRKRPDGYRAIPPAAFGSAAMHFAPALHKSITSAAVAVLNERHHALDRPAA